MFTKEIIIKLLHRWDHHDVDDAKTKVVDYGVCTVQTVEERETEDDYSDTRAAVIKVVDLDKNIQYFRIPGYEASHGAGYTDWAFAQMVEVFPREKTVIEYYATK